MIKPNQPVTLTELRKFGLVMAGMLILFSLLALWKENRTLAMILWIVAGINFLLPALFLPTALRPIYRWWMKLAFALGWLNQRIILSVVFYGIFTPVSFIQKIIGRDPLHRKFDTSQETYWIKRDPEYNPKHFERQF